MASESAGASSAPAEVRRARSPCLARCALLLTAIGDSPRIVPTSREPRPSAESIMTISRSSAESSDSAAASGLARRNRVAFASEFRNHFIDGRLRADVLAQSDRGQ